MNIFKHSYLLLLAAGLFATACTDEDYKVYDTSQKDAVFFNYLNASGVNDSIIHEDFMIGSKDMNIDAICRDGSVVQCVSMDQIAHHAGFGDTGHNGYYGISESSRDDRRGTVGIGSWASDYGMNAWSIGIELVHSGNQAYPEAQLRALDGLIAYIDGYYGFESTIIDHKMWRSGNSDTSPAFAGYLANYRRTRTHDGSTW